MPLKSDEQTHTEEHSQDLITWSRSHWNPKLVGTCNGNYHELLDAKCGLTQKGLI